MSIAALIRNVEALWTRAGRWAERHPRKACLVALLAALLPALAETGYWVVNDYPAATWHQRWPGIEIVVIQDRAAHTGPRELRRYWTGRNMQGNRYYQPLSSTLFVSEYRAWGVDNRKWTHLNALLHPICVAALAGTAALLAGGGLLWRLLTGVLTAWLFAAPGLANRGTQGWIICWWPVQPDILALTFSLLLLSCAIAYARSGDRRLIAPALIFFGIGVLFKETTYAAGVGACLLLLRHPRRWGLLAMIAALGITLFFIRWLALDHVLAFGEDNQPSRVRSVIGRIPGWWTPPDIGAALICVGLIAVGWLLPGLFRRRWGLAGRVGCSLVCLLLVGSALYGPPWELPFLMPMTFLVIRACGLILLFGVALTLRKWPWPELLVIYLLNWYLAASFLPVLGWHYYWSEAFGSILTAGALLRLAEWTWPRLRALVGAPRPPLPAPGG